jgi:ABC-type transporter MlaC component
VRALIASVAQARVPTAAANSAQEQMSRSADRIANSIVSNQEQIARSVDQLTAGQEQMTREITKLQAVEQYVLYKNAEPPPRSAAAPARNQVLRSSQAR